MAFADYEEFRVLFIDKRNALIADEVQGIGTIDHTPVSPCEIIRRALKLHPFDDDRTDGVEKSRRLC